MYHLSCQQAPQLHSMEILHPPEHPATAEVLGNTIKGILHTSECLFKLVTLPTRTRGADKSLARPTSRCILFDGENVSFDASLVIRIYK